MKKQMSLVARLSIAAVVTASLVAGTSVRAQGTDASPTPAATHPDAAERKPEPGRVGSMAPVGTKPSKAELAKQKAAGGSTTQTSTAASSAAAPAAASGTGAGALSGMDRQFMMNAGKDGMKEVHMGQMAVQQGQSAEIKKLGSMIVADHTKANSQLMEIATKRGVKLDTRHSMDKMSKKDMANFDQAWLGMMVNDHQKDIAAFERQAKTGGDPELRTFAKKTLPVLQKHLKAVQAAQKKMGSTATAPRDPSATTAKAGR